MEMEEAVEDRISNLPGDILHHIHSFLGIKDGARTCVLSTRWYYIWTTVPILDFQIHGPNDSTPTTSQTEKFIVFVEKTLRRHNWSNVDKFRLSWKGQFEEFWLHSWIFTLKRCNVKELSLYLYKIHPLLFPPSLFTYESLTSLELGGIICSRDFSFPKSISFPRLKRLKLKGFRFKGDNWNVDLFSNSPVLEELILEFCIFRMKRLCILIPTLKLLKIQSWDTFMPWGSVHSTLEIDAPSLVRFIYKAEDVKEYVLSSFPTLVEAIVCLYSEEDGAEIHRLFQALAYVKCLTVNDLTLQAICYAYDMPTFHNVKLLNICDSLTTDQGLIALIEAAPNLESLVFDKYFNDEKEDGDEDDSNDEEGNGDGDYEDKDADSVQGEDNHDNEEEIHISDVAECGNEDNSWGLVIENNGCLFPHLKSVCFQEFAGNPREISWLKQILSNANGLQTMTVRYNDSASRSANVKSEKELMEEMPSFPRASPGSVIQFYSRDGKSVNIG